MTRYLCLAAQLIALHTARGAGKRWWLRRPNWVRQVPHLAGGAVHRCEATGIHCGSHRCTGANGYTGVRVCRLVRIGTGTRCIAMHPQLDRVRFDTCESLMDALEECHRQEFLKQALGLCNFEKDELSKCIHHTRIHDANERIRRTRERQKEYEKRRRAREEEVYGKNNYLKKMIEQEAAKKTEK